jgi:probable H4MPT-linked C1 transfer pathway protein
MALKQSDNFSTLEGNIAVLEFGATIQNIVIIDPAHPEEPLRFERFYLPLRTRGSELEGTLKTLLRSYADYKIRKFILTITSSFFPSPKETVEYIIDSVTKFILPTNLVCYTIDGNFINVEAALRVPHKIVSAGWRALGLGIWKLINKDALVVDFSTRTTSFIPVKGGQILSKSLSDYDRIKNNEILFYGLLETNAAFIQPNLEYNDDIYHLPSEAYSITADIFLITEDLHISDYIIDTTDKKAKFKEDSLNRLKNMLRITDDSLDDYEIIKIAHLLKTKLLEEINQNIRRKLFESELKGIILTGIGSNILYQYLKNKDEYDELIQATDVIRTAEINPSFCLAYLYATQKRMTDGGKSGSS